MDNILKKIDLVSPPISLFYKGLPSHSSSISGILTILGVALAIFFCIYQLKNLFNRDIEVPLSTSFTYFIEDAGSVTLNSSSFFHFISLEDLNDKGNEEFDFTYFNAIGLRDSFTRYEIDKNIFNYEHWLYGICNSESDIKDVEDIATHKFLTKSACIKKYYNLETKKYYDTTDANFKWPSLYHGTFHPENKFYSIIIKSCEQYILDILFKGELNCKDINEFDFSSKLAHLNFIDHYIDVLNYQNPLGHYFYKIENKLDEENYSINHLNFNPSLLKSQNGYILEEVNYSTLLYYRNDALTYKKDGDIYIGYSFYLNNRINFFERSYLKVQDVLSTIGGISNIIGFLMQLINSYINSYSILNDLNYLLNLFKISPEDIIYTNEKNIINKKLKQVENIQKRNTFFGKPTSMENLMKTIEENKSNRPTDENELKETICNQTLESEKSESKESPKDITPNNKETIKEEKEDKEKPKNFVSDIFSFCEFLIYKITFGKKYHNLEAYENFYKKVISVENMIENDLKMNNLMNKGKRISKVS